MKTKNAFLVLICASLIFIGLINAGLAAAATTFPIDKAGISAYVKLDSFTIDDYNRAKQNYFNTLDSFTMGETYVIGVKKFSVNGSGSPDSLKSFYIYLGNDGWLVAYLWRENYGEFSQIINWHNGATLDNTMLKVALDDAAAKIAVTYSAPIKYYDFSHPDATKMTIISESVDSSGANSNDFTVYVPGTIYVASYSVNCEGCTATSWASVSCSNSAASGRVYGGFYYSSYRSMYYPNSIISGNQSYKITISRGDAASHPVLGSLLIYKTD